MTLRNGFVAADALGRAVSTPFPPRRIVSLVPSETESVLALHAGGALVGRTDYCAVVPGVSALPSVGGTKSLDVARVLALQPDLVLANQEENGERAVRELIERGVPVHVSFPVDLAGSVAYLESLAALLHQLGDPLLARARAVEAERATVQPDRRALVLIWRDPWMSLDERTYASDVLRAVGLANVCAERARRYPLAADLDASASARPAEGRDTRYPRLSLEENAARDPDVVLLPDEPYSFGPRDAAELAGVLPRARFVLVPGASLFWYGARMVEALPALAALVA